MGNLPRDTKSTGTQQARLRVLVVDDEKLIADTCTEILESAGFHARTAYDGPAALEMAAAFQPDYLLIDVLMPLMNGVEVAIAISKLLPAARVVLFSGEAEITEILLQGRDQGYEFEVVAKPVHPLKLIERLQNA
jgi:CheY-like chemotaxis protein